MSIKKCGLALSLLITSNSYSSLHQHEKKYIADHMARYTRPVTVFEVMGKTETLPESLTLSKNKSCDAVYAILLLENFPKAIKKIETMKSETITVLNPSILKPGMLKSLAACEQPDVVLLHSVSKAFKLMTWDFIKPFMNLGDYLLVDIEAEDLELFRRYETSPLLIDKIPDPVDGGFLAVFKTDKKGTLFPRWTKPVVGEVEIKYLVTSNFSEKFMFKKALKTTTPWDKGINLLTFVMLNGVYPRDATIIKAIEGLSHLKHNDLVIGNLLMQGSKLKAIDFNDKRHDISSKRCIKGLLKAFRKDRRSLLPHDFHDYYREVLYAKESSAAYSNAA